MNKKEIAQSIILRELVSGRTIEGQFQIIWMLS